MYVLTYNAPHRKTQDLLFRLKMKGYDNVVVLAVPWINRKNFVSLIPHRHFNVLDVNPIDICDKFQYKFVDEYGNADDNTYERFITDKGHRLNNCEWMVHENGDIINKTGDLPF